ncbi:MAG: MFS transporter [Rhodospirillales bacterium]|jgi:MFS family permease
MMISTKNASSKKFFGSRLPFFYGWIIVAVAFVTMAIGVNARTSFSLLFPSILDEFGWSRGTIAATFSIGFIASMVITPFIGAVMDTVGPRVVLPLGAVLASVGLILTTYSTEPWHFYLTLGVLVVGGSVFMSYIGHTLFLPNWFDRRRGLAIGLAFAGAGVGAMLIFPWMQRAIQVDGWRYACIVIAAILIVIIVPLNILFQRHRPEDLGLEVDGGKVSDENVGRSRRVNLESRIVDRAWVETEWTVGKAVRTSRFWWLLVAFTLALYAWYAVQVHQTRYLIDVGISAETAAFALGLVGLAGVFGQIGVGALSDRIGREFAWTLALVGFLLTYACLLILNGWPSEWLIYVMVGLQGFVGYGLASVFGTVPAELFSGKNYGKIFGIIGAVSSSGAAIGPWATGMLFDVSGNYETAFIVAMVLCVLSTLAMWAASPRKIILVAGMARATNS